MNLLELAAFNYLGLTTAETLPDTAVRLFESGLDSPALILLAGSSGREDPGELRDLFRQAAEELGVVVTSKVEAAEILKRYWAGQVLGGNIDPAAGVSHIINDAYYAVDAELGEGEYVGSNWDIAELIGAFYSLDDFPDPNDQRRIRKNLIHLCSKIVGEGAV